MSASQAQPVSDPALRGAIDIHSHVDPDGYGPGHNGRGFDSLELAKLAKEAGMRGFVIKMHYDQSADDAYLVRQIYPDLEVFGGIGTNFATGGLNPAAIRQMADVKGGWGRIVWMPTWDAKHYVEHNGNDRPFITVAKDGQLVPEAKALIAAVAEVNGKTRGSGGTMVLATGHNAPEEVLLMVREARGLGLAVIVTHPLLESVGMSIEQMKKAVEMGAYLEFVTAFTRQEATIASTSRRFARSGPSTASSRATRAKAAATKGMTAPTCRTRPASRRPRRSCARTASPKPSSISCSRRIRRASWACRFSERSRRCNSWRLQASATLSPGSVPRRRESCSAQRSRRSRAPIRRRPRSSSWRAARPRR